MINARRIASLLLLSACFASAASIASGDVARPSSGIDPDNVNSLQRGARNFMNYCSGCHSAQYVRYKTIGNDLELAETMLIDNLMFNADKTFETILTSMPAVEAARWFGTTPPDLSLMARAKGADYVYNFLKGFYVSDVGPTGVDNLVLPGTSMPHVLWELQGLQAANFTTREGEGGTMTTVLDGFEMLTQGSMDEDDFDEFVRDTVNFLAYIAEPIRSDRRKLGTWVIMYLLFFLILARMLKKQIWKDVN